LKKEITKINQIQYRAKAVNYSANAVKNYKLSSL